MFCDQCKCDNCHRTRLESETLSKSMNDLQQRFDEFRKEKERQAMDPMLAEARRRQYNRKIVEFQYSKQFSPDIVKERMERYDARLAARDEKKRVKQEKVEKLLSDPVEIESVESTKSAESVESVKPVDSRKIVLNIKPIKPIVPKTRIVISRKL